MIGSEADASRTDASPFSQIAMASDLLAVLEREGVTQSGGSARPFRLAGEVAWLVRAGYIDVFSVAMSHGEPVGSRSHRFRVQPTGLLLSTDPLDAANGIGLIGVASPAAQLFKLPLSRLRDLSRDPQHAVAWGELLDEWVDLLCGSISLGTVPENSVQLDPGCDLPLLRPEVVRPRTRVCWIRHESGRSLWLGREGMEVAGHAYLPVPRSAWLQAEDGSHLTGADTPSVLAEGDAWGGLEHLHRLVLRCTEEIGKYAEVAERERLRQRQLTQERTFHNACSVLAATLDPDERGARMRMRAPAAGEDQAVTMSALFAAARLVGESLGMRLIAPPEGEVATLRDPVAAIARSSRVRVRRVVLADEWWKQDGGALLAQSAEDRRPLALLPGRGGYVVHDPVRREQKQVTPQVAEELNPRAYTFYRGFGSYAVGLRDVVRFGLFGSRGDVLWIVALAFAGGLLSLVPPIFTAQIFNDVVPGAERFQLLQLVLILLSASVASAAFMLTSGFAVLRLEGRMSASVQAALWDRLLSLSVPFFRRYTAGELASRAMAISAIRRVFSSATVNALMGAVFALFQIALLFRFNKRLALWAVGLILIAVAATALVGFLQLRYHHRVAHLRSRISGLVLQFLTSISKLRIAGAEVHAFALWANAFSEERTLQFKIRSFGNMLSSFNAAFPVASSVVLYALALNAVQEHTLRTGDFLGFVSAYGTGLASLLAASIAVIECVSILPLYEQAEPILQALPEVGEGRADPGRLRGQIEVQHLGFRYERDGQPVLHDLSLRIEAGEFIALVGPSGSGKSTLFRLLLGFESPEYGAIYYDGLELGGLDVHAVRNQIGVVLQNGRIMSGDLFTNIVGSAPLTVDDAWEAARLVGFDEDIHAMPMGMHTVVSEGASTLSGGQRQRLLIARAIVKRPRIVFFDEATSALDNRTQAIVSRSLSEMQVTRVVVAHRLSTIINADRIIVLEGGRIVQEGTYDALMRQPGPFAELAQRQLA